MIDTVLDWNREAVPEKFVELSHAADVEAEIGGAGFIRWLRTLKARIGITGGLAAHGVTRAHLPQLVPLAAKDFTAQTNPRPTVEADYERFFTAAMQ
jgi:alcohol dehydrogenase class IV